MTHEDTTPVPAGWLALREPADERTRSAVTPLLLEHLAERLGAAGDGPPAPLRVVDLGAGTGANLRHLAPALADAPATAGRAQEWVLLDHDADLLRRAADDQPAAASVTTRLGDLADLDDELAGRGADLVTCAALLDLLRPDQVDALARSLVRSGTPALLSLTVSGGVDLDPPHPADAALRAAFDAHQQRGGRLGPRAAGAAAQALAEAGARVLVVPAPWRLGPEGPDLLDAWLDGRAEAAAAQDPSLAGAARGWLDDRRAQVAAGRLVATVHHVDLAALPPTAGPVA